MQDSKSDMLNPKSEHDKKEKTHRILIIILGFFCGLTIILFSLVLYFAIKKNAEICLTRDCTLTAATLISAMDHTVDPCEDFYKFTCADFVRKNPVPEHKDGMTTFLQYEETLQLQLKDLIENYVSYKDPDVIMKAQEIYHVCLNTSYNSENEFAAFKSYIEDVLDGWPIVYGSKWKPKFERFDDYMVNILSQRIPIIPFVNIRLNKVEDESTKEIKKQPMISYSPTYLSLKLTSVKQNIELESENSEKEIEEEEEIRKKNEMEKFLKGLLKLFGNPDEFEVLRDIQKMEEYSKYSEELYEEATNVTTNHTEITIKELTETLNQTIDWLKIINAQFRGKPIFTNSSNVTIRNLEALKGIPKILKKIPRRVIVNSFVWNYIFPGLLSHLGIPDIDRLFTTLYEDVHDKFLYMLVKAPRWEKCLRTMKFVFPMVITRMFVNKFVDRNGKVIVDEMIQLIQEAYKGRIQNSNWLDDSTKKRALKKADAIQRFVAYPDFIFNNEDIQKEYDYLSSPNSTWFSTMIQMQIKITEKFLDMSEEEIKNKWFIYPLAINAFYEHNGNSIWFPSGILQLPFFDENRLAAVNFGMIGSIIGHEIGHAFDDYGSKFNESGGYELWWSNETSEIFTKKTECFINQYNEYCPEELQGGKDDEKICVNGEYTIGENLADTTGLRASWDAYKLWIKKNGVEPRLPGLEQYSPEQVFFISFGHIWCQNLPPDKWLDRYQHDSHSPGNYRVQGVLSNMPEFRDAFNCKKGPYNRGSDSCAVW